MTDFNPSEDDLRDWSVGGYGGWLGNAPEIADLAAFALAQVERAEAAEEERRRAVAQLIQLEGERIKWRARAEAAEDALARIRFLCGDHPGDENQREIMEATRLAAHKEDRDA